MGFTDKSVVIKWFVVCIRSDAPFDLLNGLALRCHQPFIEVITSIKVYSKINDKLF